MSRNGAIERCWSDNLDDAPALSLLRPPRCAGDVMISNPKTLPAHASVEHVRAVLVDDHVHMVLLTDGATLRGTLMRADLPPALPDNALALSWAVLSGRTIAPETPLNQVRTTLAKRSMRRLAVVGADRTLLGLVCLKRSGSGFCSDRDVAARAAATAAKNGGLA